MKDLVHGSNYFKVENCIVILHLLNIQNACYTMTGDEKVLRNKYIHYTYNVNTLNKPSHEIKVRFVLGKLIFQTCMRSHQVGTDV